MKNLFVYFCFLISFSAFLTSAFNDSPGLFLSHEAKSSTKIIAMQYERIFRDGVWLIIIYDSKDNIIEEVVDPVQI